MALLAHQGGWDEILLVLGPILLIVLLLRVARRRALRVDHTQPDAPSSPDTRSMSAPNDANRPTRSS